jgi:chromosome condensin MukBEF complex kleisin-like MukF subunit
MRLHQVKKFLHVKGNSDQNEETMCRRGENHYKPLIRQELISRLDKELRKLSTEKMNN